jgi:hypothetical protein
VVITLGLALLSRPISALNHATAHARGRWSEFYKNQTHHFEKCMEIVTFGVSNVKD